MSVCVCVCVCMWWVQCLICAEFKHAMFRTMMISVCDYICAF